MRGGFSALYFKRGHCSRVPIVGFFVRGREFMMANFFLNDGTWIVEGGGFFWCNKVGGGCAGGRMS